MDGGQKKPPGAYYDWLMVTTLDFVVRFTVSESYPKGETKMAQEKEDREQNPQNETEKSPEELTENDLNQVSGGLDASSKDNAKMQHSLDTEYSNIEIKRNTWES